MARPNSFSLFFKYSQASSPASFEQHSGFAWSEHKKMWREHFSMPSDSTHSRNSSIASKLPKPAGALNAQSFPLRTAQRIVTLGRMKHTLLAIVLMFSAASTWAADYKRTEDVIYGRKFGTALTLDVIEPEKKNGAAVIWMVSGGFFSSHEAINPASYKPLLDHGYTVFAVVHGSQPRFIIPEIMQDVHRAMRFIRHNASKYGVDGNKLGVSGGSAGGHLSLILGTQGGPGNADVKDPIDRESSAVQAVACFYPPTDFANWGAPDDDGVGFGTTIKFKPAFGPRSDTAEGRQALSKEISPIHFVHSNMPPILIVHGDADKLVPIYQAQIFDQRVKEAGSRIKVIVKPGKDHGWLGMDKDMEVFAQWFDEHLLHKGKAQTAGAQ
jgi:acetyl esterase/lipase